MWEYYEVELKMIDAMLKAAKSGDNDTAYYIAKELEHLKITDRLEKWINHILINYKPQEDE